VNVSHARQINGSGSVGDTTSPAGGPRPSGRWEPQSSENP
jgi:hypothetical protein